jgi:hypothetical protein
MDSVYVKVIWKKIQKLVTFIIYCFMLDFEQVICCHKNSVSCMYFRRPGNRLANTGCHNISKTALKSQIFDYADSTIVYGL